MASIVSASMAYHAAARTKEGEYLKVGIFCDVEGHHDVQSGLFGIGSKYIGCYRCAHIFNVINAKALVTPTKYSRTAFSDFDSSVDSIWVICGSPGHGKSTVINALSNANKKTSGDVLSTTTQGEMKSDIEHPVQCNIEGLENLFFCDSEGLNPSAQHSSKEELTTDEIKDIAAIKFQETLKMVLMRNLGGAAGVILCLQAGAKISKEHELFMRGVTEFCGEIPVIICVTRCDEFGDKNYGLNKKSDVETRVTASKRWAEVNYDNLVDSMRLKRECTSFVFTYENDDEITEPLSSFSILERGFVRLQSWLN
jgi:GTPase Era involved in 16S rRNA processing